MKRLPFLHRVSFWYSWSGYRGSQFIWGFSRLLKKVPDSTLVKLPNGFPLIVNERDWITKTIYQGTYERSLLHFLNSLFLSNLVVDIGANIGVTLWHGLKSSSPTTKYIALEPSKQCLPGLEVTTSHMEHKGILLKYAIGNLDGTQVMYGMDNEMHSGGASLILHPGLQGNMGKVEIRKLDTIMKEYCDGSPVSLLKIDTEGFEEHIIAGAHKLLASGLVEIIIMEVSPNFGDVSYLTSVNQLVAKKYYWFMLAEKGRFKRSPLLRKISFRDSLEITKQWNLVLVRIDILDTYRHARHPLFLE